jgi:methylmalonyl-CoA mutase N-terminal domain/subunit
MRIDPGVLGRQKARLSRVRADRDGRAVERALGRVAAAAGGTDNLVPVILEAVQVYATIGEMCDVLRGVFSTYRPPVVV